VWRTGDGRDAEAGSSEVERGGGRGCCGGGGEGEREEEAGHRRGGRGKHGSGDWRERSLPILPPGSRLRSVGAVADKSGPRAVFFSFFSDIWPQKTFSFFNCFVSWLNH
jgi:hypothetical protein